MPVPSRRSCVPAGPLAWRGPRRPSHRLPARGARYPARTCASVSSSRYGGRASRVAPASSSRATTYFSSGATHSVSFAIMRAVWPWAMYASSWKNCAAVAGMRSRRHPARLKGTRAADRDSPPAWGPGGGGARGGGGGGGQRSAARVFRGRAIFGRRTPRADLPATLDRGIAGHAEDGGDGVPGDALGAQAFEPKILRFGPRQFLRHGGCSEIKNKTGT